MLALKDLVGKKVTAYWPSSGLDQGEEVVIEWFDAQSGLWCLRSRCTRWIVPLEQVSFSLPLSVKPKKKKK